MRKNLGSQEVDIPSKRPGSITSLLVGIVLLVTVAGIVGAFFPVFSCPRCARIRAKPDGEDFFVIRACECCGNTWKVTLFDRLLWKPAGQSSHRSEGKVKLPEEKK